MSVLCSNCGEELLGAVNRCWKCGRSITPHDGPSDIPPVRRAPIGQPLDAVAVEAFVLESSTSMPAPRAIARRGSPFAAGSGARQTPPKIAPGGARDSPAVGPAVPKYAATYVAGWASVVLAIIAFLFCRSFPIGSIVIALAAIGFGIWGLYGRKPRWGLAGVVLGCLCLAAGIFFATVELYEYLYGENPFASQPPGMLNR